jgi:ATP-dependent helicase HrpA
VTLFGLALSTEGTVMYDSFDPAAARELFIEHALVAGEWETHHGFAHRNDAAIAAVLEVETRERRSDLLVTDDEIVSFFDSRIPPDVTSVRHFDAWWKIERQQNPHLLDLGPEDLIDPAARSVDEVGFPPAWEHGDLSLPLGYQFDPSSPGDGVTIDVPLGSLDRINPVLFEWNVPGLRADLVTALIRSLPKSLRRQFAPIPDTAREIATSLDPATGGLGESLAKELTRRSGSIVRPDDLDFDRVPTYLRPRYRILDPAGGVVVAGDDLATMRAGLREAARATLAETAHPIERDGVTEWNFGALPGAVEIGGAGHAITAFPALVDRGASVSIRLMATREEQAETMWEGLRRLVILQLPSPRRLLRQLLDSSGHLSIARSPYASSDEFMEDCLECAVDAALITAGAAWDATEFEHLMSSVRADLERTASTVSEQAAVVLDSLHAVNVAIEATSQAAFGDALDDVAHQMERFVFPGFLTAVGADRIEDVRRYLDAIGYRLERLPEHPDRDRERMALVTELEAEHDDLTAILSWSPELVDIAWMLQELRVSLFAQPVGVKGSVSAKRIRTALADLLS